MNKNSIFFLFFAIIVAGGFTWLNSTWLSFKGFSLDRQDKQIDYYLSDFSILNTYPDGSMRYILRGQNLVHQQSNKASKIIKPTIEAHDQNGSVITIVANEAQQDSKNGPILLTGDVDIKKKSEDENENFDLLTSDLSYNPISRELSTQAKLNFVTANGVIDAVGFSTKLDEQELRIHNDVQAKFIPAK